STTTGLPSRAMITSSPASARATSSESLAFASAMFIWTMLDQLSPTPWSKQGYATLRAMATPADIRRAALALPQVTETQWHRDPWFVVGKKSFVLYQSKDQRWIFKLPKPRQEFLFEVRPDVFAPFRAGAIEWAYVDIAALTRAEAKQLVTEAWTMVVP